MAVASILATSPNRGPTCTPSSAAAPHFALSSTWSSVMLSAEDGNARAIRFNGIRSARLIVAGSGPPRLSRARWSVRPVAPLPNRSDARRRRSALRATGRRGPRPSASCRWQHLVAIGGKLSALIAAILANPLLPSFNAGRPGRGQIGSFSAQG